MGASFARTVGHLLCRIHQNHDILPVGHYTIVTFVYKNNVVTLKSGSEITQDHRKCYHLIDRVWIPISVL